MAKADLGTQPWDQDLRKERSVGVAVFHVFADESILCHPPFPSSSALPFGTVELYMHRLWDRNPTKYEHA